MEYYYEKLEVWKQAVDFAISLSNNLNGRIEANNHQHLIQELETSAVRISTTIAKGKGYPSKQDFTQHLYHSRGFIYETMTLLEILKRKHVINEDQYADFNATGQKLTAMLTGLIKSIYNRKSKSQNDQVKSEGKNHNQLKN